MHGVDLAVVVGEPLEEDGLGHTVAVTLSHVWLDTCLGAGHTWKTLEALGRHSVQVVNLEHLIKHCEPRLLGEVGPRSLYSLGLHVLFLRVHLKELVVVGETEEVLRSNRVKMSSIDFKEVDQVFVLLENYFKVVLSIVCSC